MGCKLDSLRFESQEEEEIFLFPKMSLPALMPTQSPTQWTLTVISPVAKLTTCLYLVLRFRMSGVTPPLFPYAFITCTGTSLPLILQLINFYYLSDSRFVRGISASNPDVCFHWSSLLCLLSSCKDLYCRCTYQCGKPTS